MKKKLFRSAFAVFVFAFCLPAQAQQQTKVFKIGWRESGSTDRGSRLGELFRRKLRDLGYVEGKNIAIEYRSTDNKLARLPNLAAELVRLNVDVLVTVATPAAIAGKNATRTIPMVFIALADAVEAGLIDSLARPGGNITGCTSIATVLAGKRLELLKETVPKLSRVALPWDAQNPGSAQAWKESQLPARALGLQLHSMVVSGADKFEGAFKDATKARSAALAVTPNVVALSNLKQIVELAAKARRPAIYFRSEFVESGGLMSYGADLKGVG